MRDFDAKYVQLTGKGFVLMVAKKSKISAEENARREKTRNEALKDTLKKLDAKDAAMRKQYKEKYGEEL